MENKKSIFWKSAVINGAIFGGILIAWSIVTYVLNITFEKWIQYVSYAIMIGAIVYLIIEYRKQLPGKGITYSHALGYGVAITAVAATLSAIYSYLLFAVIDPDLISQIVAKSEEQMLGQGLTEEQVEQALEMQKGFMSPAFISLVSIPASVFFGFIISLIAAIFLKKESTESPFDSSL